ncbi:MAG: glycosyltransferase family 87 protein [Planctomycetota bacterium]
MIETRVLRFLFPADDAALRRRDRVIAILGALVALVLVLRAARKDGGVLETNQAFGGRFLAREDPYFDAERQTFVHRPYPPSYAWITAPLSLLPTKLARVAWASAQVGALALAFVVLRRWAREHWPSLAPHAAVVFALALLLASRYVLRDMAGGGGNTLYAASILYSIDCALRARRARAGWFLALPLVLKPSLAPVALFFLRRKHRAVLAWTAGFGLVLFWTPAAWFGARPYGALAARWFTDVTHTIHADAGASAAMPDLAHEMNQSLRGALGRALADPDRAGALALAAVALLAAIACAHAWRARSGRAEILSALAFFPLALLASPISWKAHHAALVPVFFVLVGEALGPPRRRALAAALCVYYVACVLASGEVVGGAWKSRLEIASLVTLGDLVLLALLWTACRRAE